MTAQLLTHRVAMTAEEGWGFLFHWGAFGIKRMVEEKIISTSFDGAAWGVGTWHWRCPRKDNWCFGCPTLARGRLSAT